MAISANGSLFADAAAFDGGGGFDCDDDGDVSVLVGRNSSALPMKVDSLPNGSKFEAGGAFDVLKFNPKLLKSGKFDDVEVAAACAVAVLLLLVGANAPNKSSKPDDFTCDSDNRSGIADGAAAAAGAAVPDVSNEPSKSKLASFGGTFALLGMLLLRGSIFNRSTSGCAISGITLESIVSFTVMRSSGVGGFAGRAGGLAGFGGGIDDRGGGAAGCDGRGGGGRSCDFDVGFVTKIDKIKMSSKDISST